MATIYPDEGLDLILGIFPKNGTNLANLYMGLFTSQTATTVPNRDATGGASPTGWVEATGTGYARVVLAAASWGAEATVGNGRETTAAQVTFPTVGAGGWGTINGFFFASLASSQAGDNVVYFANFDDLTAIVSTENDIIRVTPRMGANGT